jgi:nickel/cobalt exporter
MEHMLLAGTSLMLGALHALEPGHGKSIVASYILGNNGKFRQIFILGGSIALSHTFTIIVIAFLIQGAGSLLIGDEIHHTMEAVSSCLVIGIGVWMLLQSMKKVEHTGECGCGHDHDHEHDAQHTHHPEGSKSTRIAFLGITTGIIPCPSALAALLSSVAVGKITSGLLIVILFSAGIALTLMTIAFIARYATSYVERFGGTGNRGLLITRLSASFVILLGMASLGRVLVTDLHMIG